MKLKEKQKQIQKQIQKQSRAQTCLQNRLQNILQNRNTAQNSENSNACAPINTVSRSGTQSTYIWDGRTYKPTGGVL